MIKFNAYGPADFVKTDEILNNMKYQDISAQHLIAPAMDKPGNHIMTCMIHASKSAQEWMQKQSKKKTISVVQ